jgi:hypothetical protein
MKKFYELIHGPALKAVPGGIITVCRIKKGCGPVTQKTVSIADAITHAEDFDKFGWHGVFSAIPVLAPGTDLTDGKRGSGSDAAAFGCLWVDIDVGKKDKEGKAIGPQSDADVDAMLAKYLTPSFTVSTGHGTHAYWLLDEPIITSEPSERLAFKTALVRLQKTMMSRSGMHLDSVGDLARVMRVPGTTNRKQEPFMPVVANYPAEIVRYSMLDLLSEMDDEQKKKQIQSPIQREGSGDDLRDFMDQVRDNLRNDRNEYNHFLNREAYSVGHLVPAYMSESEAINFLLDAASVYVARDGVTEARATIASGVKAGQEQTREPWMMLERNKRVNVEARKAAREAAIVKNKQDIAAIKEEIANGICADQKTARAKIQVLAAESSALRNENKSERIAPPSYRRGDGEGSIGKFPVDMFPDVYGNNKYPSETLANLRFLMEKHNVSVSYDVIKKANILDFQGKFYNSHNKDNNFLTDIKDMLHTNGIRSNHAKENLDRIASENTRNPVKDWIEAKPWDGDSRFEQFADSIRVASGFPKSRARWMLRRWMLSAVNAAVNAVASHVCLVLFSPHQGIGKTRWCLSMVPAKSDWALEGAALFPGNKDCELTALSHWICELGEVDRMVSESSTSYLKNFLTRKVDKIRRPYAVGDSSYDRQTVFIATTNKRDFLDDKTGNRRYLVIECDALDPEHGIDIQQLWAEMAHRLKAGEQPWPTENEYEELLESNSAYTLRSTMEEMIEAKFDFEDDSEAHARWMSATEICIECGIQNPTKGQKGDALAYLRSAKIKTRKPQNKEQFLMPRLTKSAAIYG